jgi:hypothetical protein
METTALVPTAAAHPSFRRFAVAALLLSLLLLLLSSCVSPPQEFALGTCASCSGTGRLGRGTCPTCQGIGFLRVEYSYPVVDPVK